VILKVEIIITILWIIFLQNDHMRSRLFNEKSLTRITIGQLHKG